MTTTPSPPSTRPRFGETRRIQLFSPVLHIGSYVSRLNPYEYVRTENWIYQPDQEALARALQAKGRLPEYLRAIKDRKPIAELLRQVFGQNWNEATTSEGRPLFPAEGRAANWAGSNVTDIRPMLRNGMGERYLPGTSIKGAIRTAVAYYLLKHSLLPGHKPSDLEKRLQHLKESGQMKKRRVFLDDDLMMDALFCDFTLTYQGRMVDAKSAQNRDLMRAVHVSDTAPLIEGTIERRGQTSKINTPVVAEVVVSSHFEGNLAKYRASLYVELLSQVLTEFTLSIDTELLSWMKQRQEMPVPFKTVQELIEICKEFTSDQWAFERSYWSTVKNNLKEELDFSLLRDFYERETCPFGMRLGWGSGMTGTTVDLLFSEPMRQIIRDECGIAAPGFRAPKSRRSLVDRQGEIRFVPGWAQTKVLAP